MCVCVSGELYSAAVQLLRDWLPHLSPGAKNCGVVSALLLVFLGEVHVARVRSIFAIPEGKLPRLYVSLTRQALENDFPGVCATDTTQSHTPLYKHDFRIKDTTRLITRIRMHVE